jgi:hypothetical protein
MPLGPEDITLTGKTLTGGTISGATISGGSISGMTDVALADGGTGTSLTDPNIDRVMGWDDSAGVIKFMSLTDLNTEAAPASGDFVLMYDAAGNLLKTDWANLPGVGSGITDIVQDLTPQLGGDLDANTHHILMGSGGTVEWTTDTTLARSGAGSLTIEGNVIYRAGGTDVPVADGGTGSSTAAGAATNLGLGTGDSPQFTAVNIGHASDTTLTKVSAGRAAIEGKTISLAPKGYLWDLTLTTDAGNNVTVAAGEATDEGGTDVMILTGAITKSMAGTWVVGSAQNGLNTGAEANSTWYEVHLIKRADTNVVDVMMTTTANRATLPTNYTLQRRIGWIFNDGSGNIKAFTQVDDHFTWTTQVNDASVTATATAAALTLSAPPNSIARFRASTTGNTNVNGSMVVVFSEIPEGNVTPADTTGIASLAYEDLAAGPDAGHFELRLSATSTIEHDSANSTGSPTFDISTFGWIDHRRKMSAS